MFDKKFDFDIDDLDASSILVASAILTNAYFSARLHYGEKVTEEDTKNLVMQNLNNFRLKLRDLISPKDQDAVA